MSDLIDRQAAIEKLISNLTYMHTFGADRSIDLIEELPSAQPEITLESAIDYLHSIGWMQEHDRVLTESAHPDSLVRSSARWVSVGHKRARICSRCFSDEPYKFADHDADVYDFCPHCGAKMEVDDGSD